MTCPKRDIFLQYIHSIAQKIEVNPNKEKNLRIDIRKTTANQVSRFFENLDINEFPHLKDSAHIYRKVENAIKRINDSQQNIDDFVKDLFMDEQVIGSAIALQEILDSVKGEADKARNLGIEISEISDSGLLPAIPLARVAASIGRKIAFQKGYRFKSKKEAERKPHEIEALYYGLGMTALKKLSDTGYIELKKDQPTIKDYIHKDELDQDYPKTGITTTDVPSLVIVENKFDIKENSPESQYFLNRSYSDISKTRLESMVDALKVVNYVSQPSTIVVPDTKNTKNLEELAEGDVVKLTETQSAVRKKLYDKPLYVNYMIHKLFMNLHEESMSSGMSADQIIAKRMNRQKGSLNSLFGIKNSSDFSIDKKESVRGQNLSKTTPINDLAEYYGLLVDGSSRLPLHMVMRSGRNARLYYTNSVLNPHTSKQMRYALTQGTYSVDVDSDNYQYLVYKVAENLDPELTAEELISGGNTALDNSLKILEEFREASDLKNQLIAIRKLSKIYPGKDFITLLTTLQAVNDIRNPINGKVVTEFSVAADATASGGTLTFLQALGLNPNIKNFLKRISIFDKGDEATEQELSDMYGLMSNAIEEYINDEFAYEDEQTIIKDMLELLYPGKKGIRELSKAPTMTFVYGQGKVGAVETMSRAFADRVIDSLDNHNTRKFLARLFQDNSYLYKSPEDLKSIEGLYKDAVAALVDNGIPEKLRDLMDIAITEQYLEEYQDRSKRVFEYLKKVPKNWKAKILPAGAVIDGYTAKTSLMAHGMPLSKKFDVAYDLPEGNTGIILTVKEKLMKTVMDVSPIHGIDAAQLYGALNNTLHDLGVITVHDEIRGDVETVRSTEESYIDITKKIISSYDIHNEVMEAVAVFDPELALEPGFQKLHKEIKNNLEIKKEMMEASFNQKTQALIGDGNNYKSFFKKTRKTSETPKTRDNFNKLKSYATKSPIVARFLGSDNASNVKFDDTYSFDPKTDTIIIKKGSEDIQAVEHEIIHAFTVGYIQRALNPDRAANPDKHAQRDIKYFSKTVDELKGHLASGKFSGDTKYRIQYILDKSTEAEQIAEFVSIMTVEESIARDIYKVLHKGSASKLKQFLKDFIEKVTKIFVKLSDEDLAKDVDIEKLKGALERTVEKGKSYREFEYKEAKKYMEEFDKTLGFKGDAVFGAIDYLNRATVVMVTSRLEQKGETVLKNAHRMLSEYPMYKTAIGKLVGIYDSSSALQELVHTITKEGVNKSKKADILAKYSAVTSEQTETLNEELEKFHKETEKLSVEDRKLYYDFITKTPLHDYFIFSSSVVTAKDIDERIEILKGSIGSKNSTIVREIENLLDWQSGDWDVDNMPNGKIYNLDTKYPLNNKKNADFNSTVREYMALRGIQRIGSKKFEKLLKNENLIKLIKDHSVANRISTVTNEGSNLVRDSLVKDYYREPFELKAITSEELAMYEYGENTGWKILRKPSVNTPGIVYRYIIDSTYQPGAFTDIKLISTDIDVKGKKAKMKGVLQARGEIGKLVLNNKEKKELGLVEDFAQALVRTSSHNLAIQDSQIIRDELLKSEIRMEVSESNTDKLKDLIKAKNKDHPWFLKLKNISYSDLPPEIRARYKPVGNRASDVKGFNKEVDLVRKDIAHWLLGDSAKSLSSNPKIKWALRIAKDFVSGSKIGMVVLNPMKIARDNISNITYLGLRGVDPVFIAKNYKEISEDYAKYRDLQQQIVQLKVKMVARPNSTKLKKQLKTLENRIKKNPVSDLTKKGFINSLGSDLVSRNADTMSGLQADMHTAIEYLLTTNNGKKNYVGHFIQQLHNYAFEGEDFLKYIGGVVGKYKSGEVLQKELDKVHDRLKRIRTEEDIVNYVLQYTTSPVAESVRLGSAMTDLSDVTAKETLYRYLVESKGMSEEEAKLDVLDSFPDYKENMPMAIKQLSDLGILLFPSFWMRIQKTIYRLAKERPVFLSAELLVEEALNTHIESVVSANLVNKANTFGGFVHAPFETVGVGSIVPTHLF